MSAPASPTDLDLNPTAFAARHNRPKYGSFAHPPCPLPPDLRSDIANRRGDGHPWDHVGVALRYDADALRLACDDDPDYEVAEARAFASARRSMNADAMRRLRRLMDAESDKVALEAVKVALEAVKVALRFESECREYEVREKAEETRASTARLKVYAQKPHLWSDGPPRPPLNLPPLPPLPPLTAERGGGSEPWPGRCAARSASPPSRGESASAGPARHTAHDGAPPG